MLQPGMRVVATVSDHLRHEGVVLKIDESKKYPVIVRWNEQNLCFKHEEVKILIANPVPFTLWQLRALVKESAIAPALTAWTSLDQHHINAFFKLTLS